MFKIKKKSKKINEKLQQIPIKKKKKKMFHYKN